MSATETITSRSELLSLLTEACELEHGLACSYLYTAFTLKQDLSEGGLDWRQLQKVRLWAAQIYFVASQEMLHLGQAWNLLAAIGGTPYFLRPNFPQDTRYYSFNAPLELEPFNRRSLQRFRYYEHPLEVSPGRSFFKELNVSKEDTALPGYRTIGELYELIKSGILSIPEKQLFIGMPGRQVGESLVDFPDVVLVKDAKSAVMAIDRITHQGEGTKKDREDCHFGIFTNVLREYEAEIETDKTFSPARNTIVNPVAKFRGDYSVNLVKGREDHKPTRGNLIEDADTQQLALHFDSIYILMLRMLSYVFSNSSGDETILRTFSRVAITMMPSVIKPLGEALTLLPAGSKYGSKTAGPAFGMSRHVILPPDPNIAVVLVRERLDDLIGELKSLAANAAAPQQLNDALANLVELRRGIMAKTPI